MAQLPLDEISQLHTLDAVLQFCTIVGTDEVTTMRGAFLAAIGAVGTTPPRVLGVIAEADYVAVVDTIRIAGGTVDAPAQIAPNLGQRGAMILVGLVCRTQLGIGTRAAAPPVAQAPAVLPPTGRRVRLSQVLRQADETEVAIIPEDDVCWIH